MRFCFQGLFVSPNIYKMSGSLLFISLLNEHLGEIREYWAIFIVVFDIDKVMVYQCINGFESNLIFNGGKLKGGFVYQLFVNFLSIFFLTFLFKKYIMVYINKEDLT